jgi:hypothetical protein
MGEIAAEAGNERVQTGVRMEKRLVKVLKALAELYDVSLGDLLEDIVLHAFAGRSPFSEESLRRIAVLERIYGMGGLKGPPGMGGLKGPPGMGGLQGPQGIGGQGPQGLDGLQGPPGMKGEPDPAP